jgi:hypothetical protein
MPPRADAVRLVDGEYADAQLRELWQDAVRRLGADEDERVLSGECPPLHARVRLAAAEQARADSELREPQHLVARERDERCDDEGNAATTVGAADDGGQHVARRLATAGPGEHQRVAASKPRVHYPALPIMQLRDTELHRGGCHRGALVHGGVKACQVGFGWELVVPRIDGHSVSKPQQPAALWQNRLSQTVGQKTWLQHSADLQQRCVGKFYRRSANSKHFRTHNPGHAGLPGLQ